MKGKFRTVVIVACCLLVLLAAAPFFINSDQFRPAVEARLSSSLGRQVKVGRLGFSILSFSLKADGLSVADDPAFSSSPFLTAQSLRVGARFLPLILARRLDITSLTVEKPEVTLLRNAEGRWNFSSLGSEGAGPSDPPKADGTETGEFVIGRLVFRNGTVTVGFSSSRIRRVYQDVNLRARDVARDSSFPLVATAGLPGGGSLKLDGSVGPLDRHDAALTPLEVALSVTGLDPAKSGFVDPSSGIGGVVDSNLKLNSKNGRARMTGDIRLSSLKLVKDGRPARVPLDVHFEATYQIALSRGALNQGVVRIGSAEAGLSGSFHRQGEVTALDLKADGRNMPVREIEPLLPALGIVLPLGARLGEGTTDFDLNIAGSLDRPVMSGSLDLLHARIAGFDMGAKMSTIAAFTGMALGGDTVIEKLTSEVRIDSDGIQVKDFTLVVPKIGELTGNGTIAANSALDFKLTATLSSSDVVGSFLDALTGRKGASTRIPFRLKGTTSDPQFSPDVSAYLPW